MMKIVTEKRTHEWKLEQNLSLIFYNIIQLVENEGVFSLFVLDYTKK